VGEGLAEVEPDLGEGLEVFFFVGVADASGTSSIMMCLTPFGPTTVRTPSLVVTVPGGAWVVTPPGGGVLTLDS